MLFSALKTTVPVTAMAVFIGFIRQLIEFLRTSFNNASVHNKVRQYEKELILKDRHSVPASKLQTERCFAAEKAFAATETLIGYKYNCTVSGHQMAWRIYRRLSKTKKSPSTLQSLHSIGVQKGMLHKHSGCNKSASALKCQDFIYICKCMADAFFVTVSGVCPSERNMTASKAAPFP